MRRLKSTLSVCLGALAIAALQASANTITFLTPAGATTGGGPVDALAMITTGAGTVTITLTDLQANPTDVAQLISDFDFTLSGGQTTGTLGSSSAAATITVNGNGTTA